LTGTPVAGLIVIDPGVQIKPVKGDALFSDPYFSYIRAHLPVEAVAVHAQVKRRIPQPD